VLSTRQSRASDNFTSLVDRVAGLTEDRPDARTREISVGDVMASIGRRSYGPLLLAIGLFSVSPATIVPGMTWFSAFLALLLSLQMALGARHPWLPRRTLNTRLSRTAVRKATLSARPWAARLDALFKPRLTFLAEPPFVNVAGWICVVAALATFPLGFIPMGPVAPGLAIALFGLGLTAKDGVLLSGAAALAVGVGWFVYILIA
jgi:hypothetical protein